MNTSATLREKKCVQEQCVSRSQEQGEQQEKLHKPRMVLTLSYKHHSIFLLFYTVICPMNTSATLQEKRMSSRIVFPELKNKENVRSPSKFHKPLSWRSHSPINITQEGSVCQSVTFNSALASVQMVWIFELFWPYIIFKSLTQTHDFPNTRKFWKAILFW